MIGRKLKIPLLFCGLMFALATQAQQRVQISGRVFDASKKYTIPEVKVLSTSGSETQTDSLGMYRIATTDADSIYFFYNGKNSVKYPVRDIYDPADFDIEMHATARSKYKVLSEVTVFSDTYRMDSMENRNRYAQIFGSSRPSISTTMGSNGVPGLELGSLIEMFQFRKNKRRLAFQERLIEQERDAYIDYRFNARLVGRITGLEGKDLSDYLIIYRPPYEFVSESSLVDFYQYIIDSGKEFRRRFLAAPDLGR